MNFLKVLSTKWKKKVVVSTSTKKGSVMNQPSKKYDVSNSSFSEKLEILLNDNRFFALEKSGTNSFKVTICLWNSTVINRTSFSSNKEDAIMWALRSLNLLK